eukprot:scaffold4875_cov30-Cyclotella_meneghiniana.AAC.1
MAHSILEPLISFAIRLKDLAGRRREKAGSGPPVWHSSIIGGTLRCLFDRHDRFGSRICKSRRRAGRATGHEIEGGGVGRRHSSEGGVD